MTVAKSEPNAIEIFCKVERLLPIANYLQCCRAVTNRRVLPLTDPTTGAS